MLKERLDAVATFQVYIILLFDPTLIYSLNLTAGKQTLSLIIWFQKWVSDRTSGIQFLSSYSLEAPTFKTACFQAAVSGHHSHNNANFELHLKVWTFSGLLLPEVKPSTEWQSNVLTSLPPHPVSLQFLNHTFLTTSCLWALRLLLEQIFRARQEN